MIPAPLCQASVPRAEKIGCPLPIFSHLQNQLAFSLPCPNDLASETGVAIWQSFGLEGSLALGLCLKGQAGVMRGKRPGTYCVSCPLREAGSHIIPIFQRRKLRHREVRQVPTVTSSYGGSCTSELDNLTAVYTLSHQPT